jgi:hypothetical protein
LAGKFGFLKNIVHKNAIKQQGGVIGRIGPNLAVEKAEFASKVLVTLLPCEVAHRVTDLSVSRTKSTNWSEFQSAWQNFKRAHRQSLFWAELVRISCFLSRMF